MTTTPIYLDISTVITAVLTAAAPITGLIVWLVKRSEHRADKITTQFIGHLSASRKDSCDEAKELHLENSAKIADILATAGEISDRTKEIAKAVERRRRDRRRVEALKTNTEGGA